MEETRFEDLAMETGIRIPKFKFLKEELQYKKRIFFLPKIYKDTAHCFEGFGYTECLAGEHKKEKNPSGICPGCQAVNGKTIKTVTRFGMHLLVYSTNADGSLKKPFGYDVQAFVKNESQFKNVYALHNQYKDEMFKHDFVVSCANTDFQNLNYAVDFSCIWKTQPNAKEILEDIKQKISEFPLNRIMTPEISLETMQGIISGRIPPRYTKNQPAQPAQPVQGAAIQSDPAFSFPPAGSAPVVAPAPALAVASVAAQKPGATKSDLDILNELS